MQAAGPIAARMAGLWRRPRIRLALLGAGALGLLSPLLPLAAVPGYESALLANLVVGLLAGVIGIAAARQERAVERGELQAIERNPAAFTAVARGTFAAFATSALAILPFVGAALVTGAIGAPCSVTAGLGWYPVLPLPSAFLGAALGFLCGAVTERRRLPGALYAAVLAATFLATALPVLFGPQVFLYHHLLGFLPGPLYDEVVQIELPLVTYRLLTVAWGAATLGLVALCWRGGTIGVPAFRPLALTLFVGAATLVAVGWADRHEIGYARSNESVREELGGLVEGERCTVVHPREMKRASVLRFVEECDARVAELERFFDTEAQRPTVFLYANREQKRRLVGASGTQFAKPWIGQLHVDDRGYPHPVLKHELAHLVAGRIGRPPFGVTAVLGGLLPVQGLVEGAAVAADWPAGELTIHEQARAMRVLGLAPALPRIMSATGFYGESASRAYTYAGSFVRWLVEARGAASFARLYRDGDFHAAYGTPLPELVQEWEAWLDAQPLSERARVVAERRFKRPAIFRRPCAREVADLTDEAGDALRAGDAEKAVELYGRCSELDAGDPGFLVSQARALAEDGRAEEVEALRPLLDAHPSVDDLLRARLLVSLGDAWAHRGDPLRAAEAWRKAGAFQIDRAGTREVDVKAEAVTDAAWASAVLPYLAEGSDARLLAVRDLLERRPDYATGWYLVGRRLVQRDEPALAIAHLDRALAGTLPSAQIEREARRQRALALLALHRHAEAEAELVSILHAGDLGEQLETADLLALTRFAAARRLATR
ncbi:hypothetical protein [Vulgatibacter sp.]|uniref:tetratricopeptide repeat protein n=1 Tax=Vulgatibacter sp. TaxID=1971226 RepID=UPI00356316E8